MMDRDQLAKEIFIADNGRLSRDVAEKEWEAISPERRSYAYAIAEGLEPLFTAQAKAAARATVTAYVEAYPGFRDGWGQDPESRGARGIAVKTVAWLRARTARP